MPRSSLSRLVCALLVLILSALPLAAAEPAAPRVSGVSAGFSSLWSWLAELWGESGCFIDPDGRCHGSAIGTPSVPAENENGCYIDPHGGCLGSSGAPSVQDRVDEGCYIDPSGGCDK